MLNILFEDQSIIVAEKPAGLESQATRKLEPDMVSEIRNYIHKLSTDGRGKIVIRGWLEDGCIWFSVEDNGVGMDADIAKRILSMESGGYGVRNVNERIRLFYGEEYGMTVESEVGKGTTVWLHFPKR